MPADRRYDEREVGLILSRVAELDARERETPDARAMTQAELEQVVQDLGISTALVARATRELERHDVRNRPAWYVGGKTALSFEQTIDGRLDDATLTPMLEVLRRLVGDPGELKHEASSRIWSTTSASSRRLHLAVVEHAGRTTLRLEERMSAEAGTMVGISSLVGGGVGFFALALLVGPLAVLGAGPGWLVGRGLWKRRSEAREGELRGVFEGIVEMAEGTMLRSHHS